MNIDWVREFCLSLPGTTEEEVWENDLTFKVAGKMFAHSVLIPAPVWLSFKASEENFAELVERQGVIPAPYLARAKWVALETKDALSAEELERLLRESYIMVVAKLPAKTRNSLAAGKSLSFTKSRRRAPKQRAAGKSARKKKKPSR